MFAKQTPQAFEGAFWFHNGAWQASSLWRVCIQSVCLCLSLIRFLFGCRSQSLLDPLRQNRLIPKRPSTTDHQPLSTTAQHTAKSESWISKSLKKLLHLSIMILHLLQTPCNIQDSLSLDGSITLTVTVWRWMYACWCVHACRVLPSCVLGWYACACLCIRVCCMSSVSKCPCSVQLVQRCVQSWGDQQVSGSVATPSQRAT